MGKINNILGSGSPDPSHSSKKPHPKGDYKAAAAESKPHHVGGSNSGGKVLGMHVTAKQKKEIYANMSKQIIAQIKTDQDRQQKALQNIKTVAEGGDPEPT